MDPKDIIVLSIGAIILLIIVIYLIANQKFKIAEWLTYAVSEAEKQLGGGTGQLKLRLVYDWFVEKFPVVSSIIPFTVFSKDSRFHWIQHC